MNWILNSNILTLVQGNYFLGENLPFDIQGFFKVLKKGFVVMGIGWIFIIDHRFKVNERLSTIIG